MSYWNLLLRWVQSISQDKSNQPQQVRVPVQAEQKHGRNEKVSVKSPTGEIVEIKFKKLQSYLKKGFSQV